MHIVKHKCSLLQEQYIIVTNYYVKSTVLIYGANAVYIYVKWTVLTDSEVGQPTQQTKQIQEIIKYDLLGP